MSSLKSMTEAVNALGDPDGPGGADGRGRNRRGRGRTGGQNERREPVNGAGSRRTRAVVWNRRWGLVFDIVMTLAVVLALFWLWIVWYSGVQADRAQNDVSHSMQDRWKSSGDDQLTDPASITDVGSGEGIGMLRIPALGDDWHRAMVAGVDQSSLAVGPGWYTGSQAPGVKGNVGIAGHRDGAGAPFHDLDKLGTCDPVVIETQDRWLVYRVLPTEWDDGSAGYLDKARECLDYRATDAVSGSEYAGLRGSVVTTPDDVDVVAPVPGHPEIAATDAEAQILTLTTCHPVWSNKQRLVVHAALDHQTLKSGEDADWVPEELVGN